MTRISKALFVVSALAGVAGCAYQDPLQLPNPYPGYGGDSRSYSPYGVDPHYYYGYGMTDPFYYRYGYPVYGYYPQYPVHTCVDANRDGRCDRAHDDDRDNADRDHDGPGSGHDAGQVPGHDGRWMPPDRRRERVVPDSHVNDRPAPRTSPDSSTGAPGVAPRPESSTPKQSPATPSRTDPRSRDPASQP